MGSARFTLFYEFFRLVKRQAEEASGVSAVLLDAWRQTPESFLRALLHRINKELNADSDIKDINTHSKPTTVSFPLWAYFAPFLLVLFALVLSYCRFTTDIDLPPILVNSIIAAGSIFLVQLLLKSANRTETIERRDLNDPDFFLEKLGSILKRVPKKQLLIMVDNLDRCTAKDAMDIIRLIKTFLVDPANETNNLDRVSFIVACDENALVKHISAHGTENPYDYLRKFINIPIHIPAIHESDMYEYIKTQIEKTFGNNSELEVSDTDKQKIANIILACFAGTPRQVKRFINKLSARIYTLKLQEEAGHLGSEQPSMHPSAIALFLACQTFGISRKDLAQLTSSPLIPPNKKPRKTSQVTDRLRSLNYHQSINSHLWSAIELMREPKVRHTLARWSELLAAFERSEISTVVRLCLSIIEEDVEEYRADYFDELTKDQNRSERSGNLKLAKLIVHGMKKRLFEPKERAIRFLSLMLNNSDLSVWPQISDDGSAVAEALLMFPQHIPPPLEKISRSGAGNNDPNQFLLDFLARLIPDMAVSDNDIASIVEVRGQNNPQFITLLSYRPHLISEQQLGFLAQQWQQFQNKIVELIISKRFEHRFLLAKLILVSGQLAPLFQNPQSIETFLNEGGIEILNALADKESLSDDQVKAQLQQLILWMSGYFPNLAPDHSKVLLEWLDHGLACQRVETQWLHPVLGQISQPQIIQNAFSFGGGEAFIAVPHLLEAIHSINAQQLQNLVRSVSSNIQQTAHNIADDKMIYFVRSAFALVSFARRTGTGAFFNLSEIIRLLPPVEEHELASIYSLFSEHIDELVWQLGANVEGAEAILDLLYHLTGFRSPISQNLIEAIEEIVNQFKVREFTNKTLRIKWKRALKSKDGGFE